MTRQQRIEVAKDWRLKQLEEERRRVVLTRHYRDESETMAQVAELEGQIRAERIRLGIDKREVAVFDWNEAVATVAAVVIGTGLVIGITQIIFSLI